jgi:hypothetical protein
MNLQTLLQQIGEFFLRWAFAFALLVIIIRPEQDKLPHIALAITIGVLLYMFGKFIFYKPKD